jgi:peptidoglycan/xylan/chitin deacetylase (PgdA/CDA1 family)
MSKLSRLATLAERARLWGPLRAVRARLPFRWLTILTYHRVHPATVPYPFDRGVLDAAPEAFDRQMAVVARECSPISLGELRGFFSGQRLPPRPVLVTFDDGYRDNFDIALPILRRHGIPAVFFVATDYVAHRRLFWWDKINYLLTMTSRTRLRLTYPVRLQFDLPAQRGEAIRILLRLIKSQYGLDLERLLDELTRSCDLDWSDGLERKLADQLLVSWPELRALRQAGMEVQCHTATHRPLETISAEQLGADLELGRRQLEQQLDATVDALALPVGGPAGALESVRRAIAHAGFRFGFTNRTGVVPLASPDALHLQRIAADCDWSLPHFRAVVHLPLPARST